MLSCYGIFSELLLLLLSRFSRVRLCATPLTAAHQAPPVPGILQARVLEWGAIAFSDFSELTYCILEGDQDRYRDESW